MLGFLGYLFLWLLTGFLIYCVIRYFDLNTISDDGFFFACLVIFPLVIGVLLCFKINNTNYVEKLDNYIIGLKNPENKKDKLKQELDRLQKLEGK